MEAARTQPSMSSETVWVECVLGPMTRKADLSQLRWRKFHCIHAFAWQADGGWSEGLRVMVFKERSKLEVIVDNLLS